MLEQADYEQVYSDTWWRKLKQGTGVKGVFRDPEQRGGVGFGKAEARVAGKLACQAELTFAVG